jgi:hypothetical protein
MSRISSLVVGGDKLTAIFGGWPSFHDAEVHELHFQRREDVPGSSSLDFPRLTAKIHHWLMTSEVDATGHYVLTKHTLTTLRFFAVEDFKMEGFNHQNVIFGLEIEEKMRKEELKPFLAVSFDPSFGIDATFTCSRMEIVEAVPCDAKGNVPNPLVR